MISLCLFVFLPVGCTNKQSVADKVIAQEQKDVPFTITVPTYFPKDVRIIPSAISGPSTNDITRSVSIGITYYGSNSDKTIILYEENTNINMLAGSPSATLNINGVNILRQEADMGSASKITTGLLYSWNRNGIHIDVRVFGYDQTEGDKIVESMIK